MATCHLEGGGSAVAVRSGKGDIGNFDAIDSSSWRIVNRNSLLAFYVLQWSYSEVVIVALCGNVGWSAQRRSDCDWHIHLDSLTRSRGDYCIFCLYRTTNQRCGVEVFLVEINRILIARFVESKIRR